MRFLIGLTQCLKKTKKERDVLKTLSQKSSNLDVWQGSEYASVNNK